MLFRPYVKTLLLAGAFACSLAPQAAWADAKQCKKLAGQVSGPDDNFRPPLGATAQPQAPSKRVYLRSAPLEQCAAGQPFIVRGDNVTVYKPYKGWMQVMYIAKTGDDYSGWVKETELKMEGTMGLTDQTGEDDIPDPRAKPQGQ
jgi:hypothetical protein